MVQLAHSIVSQLACWSNPNLYHILRKNKQLRLEWGSKKRLLNVCNLASYLGTRKDNINTLVGTLDKVCVSMILQVGSEHRKGDI